MTVRGEYSLALAAIAALTAAGQLLPPSAYQSVGLLYLLAVVLLSLRVGRGPVFTAAILGAFAWDYLFIPPHFQFRVTKAQDGVLLVTYLIVALVAGHMTARIRAQARERELLQAAREREKLLAESERLHRALLDSVSHELRTPLAVITAALDSLETAQPAAAAGLLGEMRIAALRLNRLVANLLDQTRLESGMLRPRFDWCDPVDLVNGAVGSVSDALAGHPFEMKVSPDLPSVRADPTLLEHALANLVLNAALHTPPGTLISVGADVDPARGLRFVVADRGPGLSPDLRQRLYQKFERGAGARTGGVGLGLSIVRGFVAAQGGEVSAEDNPGGGARFAIYLPLPPAQPGEPE